MGAGLGLSGGDQEKEILVIDGLGEAEGGLGEEGVPVRQIGQVVVGDGAAGVGVDGVDAVAADEMEDDDSSVGFEGLGEAAEGGAVVAEVWGDVHAESDVEAFGAEVIAADVGAEEVGINAASAGVVEHPGREIERGDTAWGDGFREPGGDLAGAAADFEDLLARLEVEGGEQLFESGEGLLGGGAVGIPGGGVVVEELDTGIGFERVQRSHSIGLQRSCRRSTVLPS